MKQKITTVVTPLPKIIPNLNLMLILLNISVFILSHLCHRT